MSSVLIAIEAPDAEERTKGIDAVFVRKEGDREYRVYVGKVSKVYNRQSTAKSVPDHIRSENMEDATLWQTGVHINGKLFKLEAPMTLEQITAVKQGLAEQRGIKAEQRDKDTLDEAIRSRRGKPRE